MSEVNEPRKGLAAPLGDKRLKELTTADWAEIEELNQIASELLWFRQHNQVPTPAIEVSGILPLGTQLDVEVDESLRANQVRCSAEVYAALKEFLVVRRAVAKDLDEFVDRCIDAMNPKQLKQFSARREQLRKERG